MSTPSTWIGSAPTSELASPRLPFLQFMAALRAHGFELGISQHQEILRLIQCLGQTCDPTTVARSLGSLLGKTPEEVSRVQEVFFSCYSQAYDFPDYTAERPRGVLMAEVQHTIDNAHADAPKLKRFPLLRWYLFGGLIGLILLGIFAVIFPYSQRSVGKSVPKPIPAPVLPQATFPPATVEAEQDAPLSPPQLPMSPDRTNHVARAWLTVPLPLLLIVLLYTRRRWLEILSSRRAFWDEVRNGLPGDLFPTLKLSALAPAIERQDLEDMAVLLGRGDELGQGSTLDAFATVQETIQNGGIPSLTFARHLSPRTVVLLCDVSSDMRPFLRLAQALISGLSVRGVPLIVRYFAGQATQLYPTEGLTGRADTLASIHDGHPDAALLLVSTGVGIGDTDRPGRLAAWMLEDLPRFAQRAFLHPVPSRRLWKPLLRSKSIPVRVFPLTSRGLLAVAYELAMDSDRRRHLGDDALFPPREATQDEVQLLRELVSIMADAPVELAEYLWQHICPDVPRDALARLYQETEDLSGNTIRFSDEAMAANIRALRKRDEGKPVEERMEERARRLLLTALWQSEPEPQSRAHLEWQLWCALQQIHLHGLTEQPSDSVPRTHQEVAANTLRELLNGPLYQLVADQLSVLDGPADRAKPGRIGVALPVIDELRRAFPQLKQRSAQGYVAPVNSGARLPSGAAAPKPAWPRIGGQEAIAALCAIALVQSTLAIFQVYRKKVPHELAYRLAWNPGVGESGQISVEYLQKGMPNAGSLCTDKTCLDPQPVHLSLIPIISRRTTIDYHLRARLPDGNLAYSLPVRVPRYVRSTPPPSSAMPTTLQILVVDEATGDPVVPNKCIIRDRNGVQTCANAPSQTLEVAPGTVRLSVANARYASRTMVIEAQDGNQKDVRVPLVRKATTEVLAPTVKTIPERAVATADIDTEQVLTDAQSEFVNGNYDKAISMARSVAKEATNRAWRIIGAAACRNKDLKLVSNAYRKLDNAARQYLVYVCQREGIVQSVNAFKNADW